MADRRMLHKKVIESDPFYNLPEGAQCLYLVMNADDDGFVNNAGTILTRFKAGKSKLDKLVQCRFLLKFDDVYVIKHWRVGNSLKNDRVKPPNYPGIAAGIWVKENRSYTDHPVDGCKTLLEVKTGIQVESSRNPSGILIERNRIELNGIEPNRRAEGCFERLWELYPETRRGDKDRVFQLLKQTITSDDKFESMLSNLQLWKQSDQWTKNGGQYVPYLCNWISRGQWLSVPVQSLNDANNPRELDADEMSAIQRMLSGEYDNL